MEQCGVRAWHRSVLIVPLSLFQGSHSSEGKAVVKGQGEVIP